MRKYLYISIFLFKFNLSLFFCDILGYELYKTLNDVISLLFKFYRFVKETRSLNSDLKKLQQSLVSKK